VRNSAAFASLAAILTAVGLGIGPVLFIGLGQGDGRSLFDAYLWQVLRFTLLQAGLSTLLSVGLAIPVSWVLFRTAFPGRGLILQLFALPLALPAIVAILGIVAVYGRSGLIARATGVPLDTYGLTGILIAHVFFNMPLAVRLLMQRLDGIAPEPWRLGAQLGLSDHDRFRLIGWPAMRSGLTGAASLIFLLCAASFAAVLTLGGGPRATTLEVAIYQALRFDFDPGRAGALALVQLALCGVLVALAGRYALQIYGGATLASRRYGFAPAAPGATDVIVIGLATLYVAAPLVAILVVGIVASFAWKAIATAALTSVAIASLASLASVIIALPLGYAMARAVSPRQHTIFALAGVLSLIVPPAVLATGWFVLVARFGLAAWLAFLLVAAMNTLMALPFAVGALAPAARSAVLPQDRLCASLGISGLRRLSLIDLPLMRGPLMFALAICFAVSLGDLTAIALFGSQDLVTLPSLIYGQMGSYRIESAAATALVLLALSMVVISFAERMGRGT
jgi:thiamine transport system permease protein